MRWWARVGSHLTSVQRFRGLDQRFPETMVQESLKAFSALAVASGDKRWRRHQEVAPKKGDRPPKGKNEPSLLEPCALWPRLRAGLGVGSKADTLVFLLGLRGAGATAGSISYRYWVQHRCRPSGRRGDGPLQTHPGDGRASVRIPGPSTALGRPSGNRWRDVPLPKTRASLPRWCYWSEVFAFLLGVVDWSERAASDSSGSPHVLASQARDLLEKHKKVFTVNHIQARPPSSFPGLQAPDGLMEVTRAVADWVEDRI